ncbi:hypothetical protein D1J72_06195 [Streptococcus anginosus]|nr:hypothetical protein D1J72_06195 [Streptococcus anginosus]
MPIGAKWHTKQTAKQFYARYNRYRYIIISVSIRSIWWPPFGTVKIYLQVSLYDFSIRYSLV